MSFYLPRKTLIFQFCDTLGTGLGTIDATGDYSDDPGVGNTDFFFTASARCIIARMIVSVGDTGGMRAEEYGDIGAALTNGVLVHLHDADDVVTFDLTGQETVKTNAEWGAYCYDVDVKSWGAGNDLLVARWTFEKTAAHLIRDPEFDTLLAELLR